MSRTKVPEACFICGDSPCSCNAKPHKSRRKIEKVQLPPVTSHLTEMEELATRIEQDEEAAIKALEPLLHPSEKLKYAYLLRPGSPSRVEAWKADLVKAREEL